jgi:hypothetical protein
VTIAKLVKLAEDTAEDTAKFITEDLKGLAGKHGWDSKAIAGVSVSYSNSSFSINVDSEVEDDVSRLEYGTERIAPTAVFRKYNSNTKEAEKFFIKNLEKKVGVAL